MENKDIQQVTGSKSASITANGTIFKIIGIVVAVLLSLIILYGIIIRMFPSVGEKTGVLKKVTVDLTLRRDNISNSIEGQNEYTEKIDTVLQDDKSIPDYPKLLLTITKASRAPAQTLASWGDERKSMFLESYKLLQDVSVTVSHKDPYYNEIYTRVAIELQNLYEASCANLNWVEDSVLANESVYKDFKAKYLKTHIQLPYLLYLESLFASKYLLEDKTTISTHMLVVARILDNFYKDLDTTDQTRLVTTLKELIARYDKVEDTNLYAKTYTGRSGTWYRDNIYYAYSLQVLSYFDTTITEDKVLQNYDATLARFKEESAKENYMFNATYLDYVSLMYAGYAYEVSDGKVTETIGTLLNGVIERNKILSKEATALFTFYIINAQSDMGKWDKARSRILHIADSSKTWKSFLETKGLIFN